MRAAGKVSATRRSDLVFIEKAPEIGGFFYEMFSFAETVFASLKHIANKKNISLKLFFEYYYISC